MPHITNLLYNDFKRNLPEDYQERIIEFFLSFMRFEFLLKCKGFIKDTDSTVDWDKFGKKRSEYEGWLRRGINTELHNAIDYLMQNPPRKLVLEKGKFLWKAVQRSNKNKFDLLSLNIRTLRNNLFHGNKNIGSDSGRDRRLLEASLLVISDWVTFLNGEIDFIEETF